MTSVLQSVSLENFIPFENRKIYCANRTLFFHLFRHVIIIIKILFSLLVILTCRAEITDARLQYISLPNTSEVFTSFFRSVPYSLKNSQAKPETGHLNNPAITD